MENKNDIHVDRWTNERLGILTPGSEWHPNVTRALERFREVSSAENRGKRLWTWSAAAGLAVFVCLMLLPGPRAIGQRCLNYCSATFKAVSTTIPGRLNLGQRVLSQEHTIGVTLQPIRDRKPAPNFELKDSLGKTATLKGYRGKVVLLDFWATWCHGCKEEIPWFSTFEKTYGLKGFVVVGVSMDDGGWKVVRPFLADTNVPYRMLLGDHTTAQEYAIKTLPDTYLIDRRGKIAAAYINGLVNIDNVEGNIRTVVSEP